MGVMSTDAHLVLLNPIVDGLLEGDAARSHNKVEAVLVLRLWHRGRRSPTHPAAATYGGHEITSLAKNRNMKFRTTYYRNISILTTRF